MLSTLLTRRWLGWIALALVWALACIFLGRWQWHRFESRHAAQTLINANYSAQPVDLVTLLGTQANSLPRADQWRQVLLHGQYQSNHQVLVRNRPDANGDYGYEVIVPLQLTGGGMVFVDRGWVNNGTTAASAPDVPAAPTGQVTVVGWLRPGEPNLHHAPVPGQIASIYIPGLSAMTSPTSYNFYVLRNSEQLANGSHPASTPSSVPPPDEGMSAWVNFSYALQWWFGAIAGITFVLLRARREHLDEIGIVKTPKQPKVRIWDEEDA